MKLHRFLGQQGVGQAGNDTGSPVGNNPGLAASGDEFFGLKKSIEMVMGSSNILSDSNIRSLAGRSHSHLSRMVEPCVATQRNETTDHRLRLELNRRTARFRSAHFIRPREQSEDALSRRRAKEAEAGLKKSQLDKTIKTVGKRRGSWVLKCAISCALLSRDLTC